jgi:hypothetical protein
MKYICIKSVKLHEELINQTKGVSQHVSCKLSNYSLNHLLICQSIGL